MDVVHVHVCVCVCVCASQQLCAIVELHGATQSMHIWMLVGLGKRGEQSRRENNGPTNDCKPRKSDAFDRKTIMLGIESNQSMVSAIERFSQMTQLLDKLWKIIWLAMYFWCMQQYKFKVSVAHIRKRFFLATIPCKTSLLPAFFLRCNVCNKKIRGVIPLYVKKQQLIFKLSNCR